MSYWHRLRNVVTRSVLMFGLVGPLLAVQPAAGALPTPVAPKPAAPDAVPDVWKPGEYKKITIAGIKNRALAVYIPASFDKEPKPMLPLVWLITNHNAYNYSRNINPWAESHNAIIVYPHNGVSGTGPEVTLLLKAELNTINSLRYDRNKVYILGMDAAGSAALLAATTTFRPPAGMVVVGAVGELGLPPQTAAVLLPQEADMDKPLSNLLEKAAQQQNPLWFRKIMDSSLTNVTQMPMYLNWLMDATAVSAPKSTVAAREAEREATMTRLTQRIEPALKLTQLDALDLEVHQLLGIPVVAALPEGKNLAAYWYKLSYAAATKLADKVDRYRRLVELANDPITTTSIESDARTTLQNAITELLKDKVVNDDAESGKLYLLAQTEENQARLEKEKLRCVNRMRQAQTMYETLAQQYPDSRPGRAALINAERLKAEIPTLLTPGK
ncbi:MAG: hypothetical protein WCI73_09115 [Phycisphaerae bacterium]